MANTYDIYCIKGDTYDGVKFDFALNTAPIEINSARMQVKKKAKDEDFALSLTNGHGLTILDSSVSIDAQKIDIDSGSYVYDLELTLSDGYVKTWVSGSFVVEQDVTE